VQEEAIRAPIAALAPKVDPQLGFHKNGALRNCCKGQRIEAEQNALRIAMAHLERGSAALIAIPLVFAQRVVARHQRFESLGFGQQRGG